MDAPWVGAGVELASEPLSFESITFNMGISLGVGAGEDADDGVDFSFLRDSSSKRLRSCADSVSVTIFDGLLVLSGRAEEVDGDRTAVLGVDMFPGGREGVVVDGGRVERAGSVAAWTYRAV